ncbi:YlcI/YnfO family protein [Bacillus paranthracis]|uniref:YlcI/YnfO family protein n=1 Tax=Bacillus paranthracis TaxID=2026186 RepID=UPI00077832B5|nr:hypothetical protein AT272_27515 [Bacillus cereus]
MKEHESIVKAIRIHKRLLEQAQQAKEQYEVPISFNRFVVNAIEKEVERKEVSEVETISESK